MKGFQVLESLLMSDCGVNMKYTSTCLQTCQLSAHVYIIDNSAQLYSELHVYLPADLSIVSSCIYHWQHLSSAIQWITRLPASRPVNCQLMYISLTTTQLSYTVKYMFTCQQTCQLSAHVYIIDNNSAQLYTEIHVYLPADLSIVSSCIYHWQQLSSAIQWSTRLPASRPVNCQLMYISLTTTQLSYTVNYMFTCQHTCQLSAHVYIIDNNSAQLYSEVHVYLPADLSIVSSCIYHWQQLSSAIPWR